MTPSTLRSVHRWFTLAFCLLVLVQAVLAGRHLYDGADIDLHLQKKSPQLRPRYGVPGGRADLEREVSERRLLAVLETAVPADEPLAALARRTWFPRPKKEGVAP